MNLSKDCLESPTISAIFRQKQGSNSVITELCICSSSNNADWMIGAPWEFSMKYQQESAGLLRNQKCQMETSGRSALEWKPPLSGRGRYESCKHIHFFTFTPPLTASWSKKWEIQMLFTFSSLSGFQAIYWGDRFLKLIRHRWHHLAADQRGPGSGKQSKFVINENILTMPSTTSNLIG